MEGVNLDNLKLDDDELLIDPNMDPDARPVPPERLEAVLKRWPGGYIEPTPTGGIDWLLDLEDELAAESARTLERLMAEMKPAGPTAA